jgi:hypothetical protein
VEGVLGDQFREAAEIAIRRQQRPDAVAQAQGSDARVVDRPSLHGRPLEHLLQRVPEALTFVQENQRRRLEPAPDLLEGIGSRRRRIVDPRMGDDGVELVEAGPGNGLRCATLGQGGDDGVRRRVPGGVRAMRVDEDVGVDGGHRTSANPVER